MRIRGCVRAIFPIAVLLAISIPPGAQGYALRGYVVANGATPGGGLSGSGRVLLGTAGQAAVGQSANATHELCSGFWCWGGSRVVSVDDHPPGADLPKELSFGCPYPNPAPGAVRFALALPGPSRVELRVLDVQGRVVWTQRGRLEAGYRTLVWDGRDGSGRRAGPGVYFARLVVEDRLAGRRRIVLRD